MQQLDAVYLGMEDHNQGELSLLSDLSENNILNVLKNRHHQDKIYSRCGDILIAVNPYKTVPKYDKRHHERYHWRKPISQEEPHIYATAALAYQRLRETQTDQIILVSGESGAGKTESTKHVIEHLLEMCGNTYGDLHSRLIQINPLMEAFGNAETTLNENSSRFAKFIQIKFNLIGGVKGATVTDYLLEKSRVVHRPARELNFHIFYYFLAGIKPALKKDLYLDKEDFRIANNWFRHAKRYSHQYEECIRILTLLELSSEDIDAVHVILAAILHITEIQFDDDVSIGVIVSNEDEMIKAANLLQLDVKEFAERLVSERVHIGGEDITKLKNMQEAENGRDALAKALYERLFGWLIRRINLSLQPTKAMRDQCQESVGILDISGFEIMRNNSLEQMCINLVNEHLQNFMNHQVFKQEKEIYESEGLILSVNTYPNNTDIIDLFDKNTHGILDLIDEDTKLSHATNESMIRKISQYYSSHNRYITNTYEMPEFGIKHFAGEVHYDASQFREKNGDNLSKGLSDCIKASENYLICDLFQAEPSSITGSISATAFKYRQSNRGQAMGMKPIAGSAITKTALHELRNTVGKSKVSVIAPDKDHKTVLSYFKTSIKDLLRKMASAEPIFIRCIKPNMEKRPDYFSSEKVHRQLVYIGIKDIANIRRLAYPLRVKYEDFRKRYQKIIPKSPSMRSDKDVCQMLLRHFDREEYRLGNTQVFMYDCVKNFLDGILRLREILTDYCARKYITKLKEAVIRKKLSSQSKIKPKSSVRFKNTLGNLTPIGEVPTPLPEPDYDFSLTEDTDADLYAKFSDTNNSNDTNNNDYFGDDDNEEEDEDNKYWDTFEIVARDKQETDMNNHQLLRCIKIFLYGFLFLLLLGGCVLQKLTLVSSIANFPRRKMSEGMKGKEQFAFLMNCILVICMPYGLNVIVSTLKLLFGNFKRPGGVTLVVVLVMESLHTFGLSLIVFGILPMVHGMIRLLLLSAVAIVPSIMHLITATHKASRVAPVAKCSGNKCGKAVSTILDIFCIIGQMSVIPILAILWSPAENQIYDTHTSGTNMLIVYAMLILGFICVSFEWWENFVDDRFLCDLNQKSKLQNLFLSIRFELQEGRQHAVAIANIFKIALTIAMTYAHSVYFGYGVNELENLSDNLSKYMEESSLLGPVILFNMCGIVIYYVGYIACKLNMQIVSFSLALTLATPTAIAFAYFDCKNPFFKSGFLNDTICEGIPLQQMVNGTQNLVLLSAGGVVWYLSLLWITRHIWFPRQERLAKYERMFINPLYCGIFTAENFMLNRRRHMRRVQEIIVHHDKGKKNVRRSYTLASTENKHDDMYNENNNDVETASMFTSDNKETQEEDIPVIYACATMWHETRTEMVQLLKSFHRIDADQWMRRQAQNSSKETDPDFFNYEAHVFFDDAMELNDDEEWHANDFVAQLVECMQEAVSSVHNQSLIPHPPVKIPTPYGGQLIYQMPGGNNLYIHIKDKNKIRHRKRWSQVMYMYYLLGFKLLKDCQEAVLEDFKDEKKRKRKNWKSGADLGNHLTQEVKNKSKNTFILALDGDTDFSSVAVRLLLDRMKKNDKAGAACGRIHPIGSGPLVWYQKFEYAVGHWLQKATEHVFGCVLCSPGCFSLFRGSALMDENVMRKYTILPSEPGHYLQYDQGEDRWLCTLLLQQGYRVDYAAAADSFTYAPESFNEFFNQRRRWMPSTLANIMDLLNDYKNTVAVNNNISILYIIYQGTLMVSTILGPATVIMMIAGAYSAVFKLPVVYSYLISLAPTIVYVIICLKSKAQTQLLAAGVLSTVYAFIMVMVLAGTIIQAVTTDILNPSVLFVLALVSLFTFAGLLHPYELFCLPPGALYFICIPSGYLLLVIYSLCNMDNVSWGTREIPKKKSKAELAAEAKAAAEKKKEVSFFSKLACSRGIVDDIKEVVQPFVLGKSSKDEQVLKELQSMNRNLKELLGKPGETENDTDRNDVRIDVPVDQIVKEEDVEEEEEEEEEKPKRKTIRRNDLINPFWAEDPRLQNGPVGKLDEEELNFWQDFIRKYLKPLDKDPEKEKIVKKSLIELRNNVVFMMTVANLLWIGINFMFQFGESKATTIIIKYKNTITNKEESLPVEILGLLFIFFFAIVILIQFFGMIQHRWGTFLHIISITDLKKSVDFGSKFEETLDFYKQLHINKIVGGNSRTEPPEMKDNIPVTRSTRGNFSSFRQGSSILKPINFDLPMEYNGRVLRQSSYHTRGPNLRKTTKGLIKMAKQQGIQLKYDLPEPDYNTEDLPEDPVYNFLKKSKDTMSKQFRRGYENLKRTRPRSSNNYTHIDTRL
ncbi:chitin synthase chs-1 [Patella vulgata]|uniref:chitin synthase chs-1 n=1 Tax=Patella vulgata TaxID=6465 RepID=UPI00217F995C|nr:chitin synthase chs-1 [Patella vulgata]XP_050407590.1 chitin synthase chs-1 [Patella vulgata]